MRMPLFETPPTQAQQAIVQLTIEGLKSRLKAATVEVPMKKIE
jgi:hypothetical protein